MRVRIRHESRYHYGKPVDLGPHLIRLRPADHTRARLLSYNLGVTPKCELRWQRDAANNRIVRATFAAGERFDALAVVVDAAFEIRTVNPFNFFVDDRCRDLPFAYPDGLEIDLAPFLRRPAIGPELAAFVKANPAEGYVTDYLVALNSAVAREVRYIIRDDAGIQSSEETLARGSGSCRDSAVLLVDALRAQGLAARFVSGYLLQLTDEGNIPGERRGIDRDVVDLHAWAEVYVPGGGWIGLDGTSGLLAGEGHIPLAGTADPRLAAPIDGTASAPALRVDFHTRVERLGHEPRPRRPYTDACWAAIRALGRDVDAHLEARGLALTMGGEPTWTSRLHPRAKEWNEDALGRTKWDQGLVLAERLLARLGDGGIVTHRMGKHYPGESLPRWAMHLLWRPDGVPLWRDPSRLDLRTARATADLGASAGAPSDEDAERFARALAGKLELAAYRTIQPAFEDPWVFIREEHDLPDDVDPLAADLDDPEARRRLARVLGRGLGRPVGYVLPLGATKEGWATSPWTFRRGHAFLTPGDAPIGLRLPLQQIGGTPHPTWAQDPSQRFLAFDAAPVSALPGQPRAELTEKDTRVRTALCVEPRGGALAVFLPPLPTGEHFLALIRAVEETARSTDAKVSLEGYPPPPDPRLRACLVTPDPGVLEVNIPVTSRFDDYVELMETIADAANHAGLTTEKYQLDGREVGPGGGHHLTLGGPTTLESPFLRDPALLASMLNYLQNHPALSYLFASQFVGPTSQAPRVDEARHDALYELEIALERLRSHAGEVLPWLSDRHLRNLLTDVSGNTHRTEVCIDKLYDPGSAGGRQGILEFRAFEMPAHERMAVTQMLLLRGIASMVADRPYARPLIRWGSQLHDRFMLPHFLWRDLRDVLGDLREAGLPFADEMIRPFLDFKCPVAGTVDVEDFSLEIRTALEPWIVLGEEGARTGTVRYVDSSVERLQVSVEGLTDDRHVITVNGFKVPLRPTGKAGQHVAGIRFRAWQPPHCLHPDIPVHHPLRFDIVDTWGRRSLGAATYHVWHPEGRGFEDPPLTAFEAAARRAQRFTTEGHLPFPAEPIEVEPHPEQPYTLDLRRCP